jgi:DNA-directed RNA polymerase subunit RPC12/RpoP
VAYAHRRLYGHGIWLPLSWWAADRSVSFAIRSAISRYVLHGDGVIVTTTSVDTDIIDSVVTELRQPITLGGSHEERTFELYKKHITAAVVEWSTKVVQYLAVDRQFDQDFAIPIVRSDTDDIEMQVPCPPPAINDPDLAACTGLHWQVDVELVEAVTPRGRGLDGHALFAGDQSLYLTWMRSGRDGVAFESERFDFVLAGTPPIARLARPRLRMPGLPTWADLMAAQGGKGVRLSPAGRRVEVMRMLVGDRASLTGLFAGPMLPALRTFRPTAEKRTSESGAVVLRTGSDDHPHETYLTFKSIFALVGDDRDDAEVRRQVDEMLECGILRRGVILGCARCGKPAFVAVDDLAQVNRCPRCSATNVLSQERWKDPVAEPQWYYDLHPTAREHLSQNGEVPLLLSHHLRSTSRSYVDAPELELVDAEGNKLAETDLIALADNELIVAEAKKSGTMGAGRELRNAVAKRALLAEQLRADQIVIATADPGWEQASIEALRAEINNKPWQILAPRARVISGLGTGKVEDLVVDAATGNVSPWAPAKP